MGSMLEFFFFQLGRSRWDTLYNNFQKNENIANLQLKRKKKPNLSKLTQLFCGLLSLLSKYFWAKIKCISTTLTVVSFAATVWPHHTMPYIPVGGWACCVMRPNNGCKRDYAYNCCLKERKSIYLSGVG